MTKEGAGLSAWREKRAEAPPLPHTATRVVFFSFGEGPRFLTSTPGLVPPSATPQRSHIDVKCPVPRQKELKREPFAPCGAPVRCWERAIAHRPLLPVSPQASLPTTQAQPHAEPPPPGPGRPGRRRGRADRSGKGGWRVFLELSWRTQTADDDATHAGGETPPACARTHARTCTHTHTHTYHSELK